MRGGSRPIGTRDSSAWPSPGKRDVAGRRLDLLVLDEELERRGRKAAEDARASGGYTSNGQADRGYVRLYREHVMQADSGCDFDLLRKALQ